MQQTTPKPKVSIIIATFNNDKYIGLAIESALSQTFTDWEMIIIDDASTDNTEIIVQKYTKIEPKIKYIKNDKNLGIAKTRNIGIKLSIGEYIAPLDGDDIWLDYNKIKKQVDFLDKNPEYAILGGGIMNIDKESKHIKKVLFPVYDSIIRNIALQYNPFCQSTVLFRKNLAIKLNCYSDEYTTCSDYDLWLKMGIDHKFTNIPQVLSGYRIHGGNITHKKRLTAASEILAIIKKYKKNYKRAYIGIAKAYLRIILSYFRS